MIAAVFGFLKQIPSKVWGVVCTIAGALILIWAIFQKGKSVAKAEAKAERLEKTAADAVVVAETVVADVVAHKKIEEEVNALPVDELRARADKWVRPSPGAPGADTRK